jgi:hypothetical protein
MTCIGTTWGGNEAVKARALLRARALTCPLGFYEPGPVYFPRLVPPLLPS